MAKKPIKSINLLPEFLQTDRNSKFLSSTIDQLIQPPKLERLDGYIGSKLTPTYVSTSDVYISESLPLRRNYQLEPALVIKDELGNVERTVPIDDLANSIVSEGGIDNDFDRLFRSDFYSFDPHIDFDKFVNYQKYYWLVTGPEPISITGKQLNTTSTYSVFDNEIKSAWIFSPDGLTEDPTIVLYRGNTYNFSVNSEYKFFIKTAPTLGIDDVYNINVTNNGASNGVVSIVVNENTPETLFYTSDNVNYVQGKIVIKQATEDAFIDVENEILGKKTYSSGTGIKLSNGMKVIFEGEVYPESYKDKEYFVEGVGKAIRLVDYSLLTGSEKLAAQFDDDFDATNFDQYPFDSFRQLPLTPEYLTINRASRDLNPWSRYNRWVHEDVIRASAIANGVTPVFPADKRAKRPIIEFAADIQLYNFGSVGIRNIDLIDNETLDAFSIIEGSAGYYVDNVLLEQGHRVVFNADEDELVRGRIYEVNYLTLDGKLKLELKKTDDHIPVAGSSFSTNLGELYAGKSWWFNGTSWVLAQQHETLNQAPLFDVFDSNGISFSNSELINSDFKGTKIFSYEVGTGTPDPVLGFPLTYQNTINVGSYRFKNYFNTDVISIFENNQVTTSSTALTYLKFNDQTASHYANVWTKAETYEIPILQLYSTVEPTLAIELNAIDNPDTAEFTLQVYLDGNKLSQDNWYITKESKKCFVNFYTYVAEGTNVLFKIFTRELANENGQYETPVGLTNNPLNGPIDVVTLTEMSDHLKNMTERDPNFVGSAFSNNNVRDLPDIARYGSRLISNVNPIAFANLFLGIENPGIINSIQQSATQYNQFKLSLFKKIGEIGNINNPVIALDNVMTALNLDKDLNDSWYHSDMLSYGSDKTSRTWTITDLRNTVYPIISDFDPTTLSSRSVLVYINNNQLILNKDYRFLVNDSSIELLTSFNVGDELRVDDYFSSVGNYIPPTPTKLGLYPKYEPLIYIDTSYVVPKKVIQGHDGSITLAFEDFRDDIILEYEKRVYNNIKSEYNPELLDVNKILPGAFRQNDYSLEEVNTILQPDFIKWAGLYNVNYMNNSTFDLANPFTWNYSGGYNALTDTEVSGYWRSFFKYFYDTDRPNTHPWEMLGFSEEPSWWQNEYGPAPYTSGNEVLWADLELGLIKDGVRAGIDLNYARPGLSEMLPVDEFGNIANPSQIITNTTASNLYQNWKFGDFSPAETAWRRSSYWPFAVQRLLALTKPSSYASLLYDPSRIKKNIAGQTTYGDTFEFLNPKKVAVFSDQGTATSGYSVYISEIGKQKDSLFVSKLKNNLAYLDFNLVFKVGGFVSKNKIQIIIDAIEPTSTSPGALMPQESYKLILNVSNPIKVSSISGVIIQRSNGKFVVNGYNTENPYFTIFSPRRNSTTPSITIGGVSEPYVLWTAGTSDGENGLSPAETTTASPAATGKFYYKGQVVLYGQTYYRVKVSHQSTATFNPDNFQSMPSLPVVGGVTVQIANGFDQIPVNIPYGTEFDRTQDLYDMLVGYGKWLESEGFIFDEFNSDLNELVDWNLSAREFLYWTTQNWADNSIITLSPFANRIKFSYPNSVVEYLFGNSNDYSVLKADGLPFPQKGLNVNRQDGVCTIETVGTTEGIYFVNLRSIQKEHAMVFDNTTVFNDKIYDTQTGYRQLRMKLVGFRTSQWDGDYFSPGFVYDRATVTDWKKYTSYLYGDTVRYSGNYYSAKQNVEASTEFNFNDWVLLNEKPQADLIPNFEYKINQFEDFYSLDIDNFDTAQQKMAQRLTGYTPRVYLNNIFTNPISQYKFYQGFIKEKGTKNAIEKMAKVSIFNLQGETTFTEEWAFRLGQYGAFTSYEEIEVELEEGTFIENPQIVNFVSSKPNNPIDLIYYSTSSNIAIAPDDFVPSNTFATTSSNNFKLPNAGYVSFEDITATAYNEGSLLDIANAEEISNGDVIWLGFKSNGDWDVLRYDLSDCRVVGVFVSSPGVDITFVTDFYHGLAVGDIISVTRFNDQVNGVYVVKDIPKLNQITVESTLVTIINEELLTPGLLYSFKSARSKDFNSLPDNKEMLRAAPGTKFWVDNQNNDGTFDWKVYEKIENYSVKGIKSPYQISGQKLGSSIDKKDNSKVIMVGAPGFSTSVDNGRVIVFLKNGTTSLQLLNYTFNSYADQYHPSASTTDLGQSVSYFAKEFPGSNYGLMIAGAPSVSDLKITGSTLKVANDTATPSLAVNPGAVKISTVNPSTNNEKEEAILVSPNYSNFERFGSAVLTNEYTNSLFVSAPGTSTTGTGSVYYYQTTPPVAKPTLVSTATAGTSIVYIDSTASIAVGQTILIPGVVNNISDNIKVQSIYDDGTDRYVTLDSVLPATASTTNTFTVNFYSTSSLILTHGIFTSTSGLLVTFVNTLTCATPVTSHDEYGYAIDCTDDGSILAISAPGGNYVETYVRNTTNQYVRQSVVLTATSFVSNLGVRFGESIALSKTGDYLFVGAPFVKNNDDSFGQVVVFKRIGNTFTYSTSIANPVPGAAMNFGQEIVVNNSTDTLVVSSIGLNKSVPVKFDNEQTNFDSSSTFFFDTIDNFGAVYVFNKIADAERFVLADELEPSIADLPFIDGKYEGNNFGYSLAIDNDTVLAGAPSMGAVSTSSFYQFTKIDSSKNSLSLYKSHGDTVDIDTVQKIRLINTFDETVVNYLDVIDPIKGKIAGLAEQELKYKSAYDPAIYSIGTAGVVVDSDTSWLDEHVGELWWDLSSVKYVWYEQGDLTYRKNNWGAIFPGATIDVYEWVKSPLLPSEWSAVADTSSGLTDSISGQPKYVDNSAISVKQIYNSVSNSFSNVYYYWVKNKVTIPAAKNRRISSYQVASIIADPTTYGLNYAAIISNDAIALANVGPTLVDNRIHLNIARDNIKNTVLKHTEWMLLEEGSANSMPPVLYEKKLFDSLLGRDSLGNIVPDPSLTDRTRYGISIRPRQTMFKNRREALRTLIEFSNNILLENQITGSYNFSNLNAQEAPPDEFSHEYDQIVEDNEGLNIIDTRNLKPASISCTVLNGRIRTVTITDPGFGYKISPNIIVENGGTGAVIETEIDSFGRVISASILNAGEGYSTAPNLIVRPFSVIVLADNLYNGKWTKFEWNNFTSQWERKQTQKYNTTLYWKYVDWKSSSYNDFISYTYTVDQVYELDTIEEINPGQYVKVKNVGDGRYIVVEKAAQGEYGTFGKGYNIVFSQNGTIQILDTIWDVRDSNLGYDQNNNYDQTLYDQTPDLELGFILDALKEDIFIGELKINWNLFFFKAVKYALTEQKLLDWAFKTSFINVTNFAGELSQPPVYKLKSSENYEEYIKEVKPYHSQIRTFTANNQVFEPSNSFITDFDLPSYYNASTDKFDVVDLDNNLITDYPWKAWADNYLYSVGNIVVGNGGSGYTYPPQVIIETAAGDTGSGATAKAFISSGKVSKIEITNPGSDYKIAPIVKLSGGGNTDLIPAVAYAQLYNGKVRTNKVGIKFDRISKSASIITRDAEDSFSCNGSVSEFVLTWFADPDKTKMTVTIDDELVLSSDYRIEQYKEFYSGYNKNFTKIVFLNSVPSYNQILKIKYLKNIELLNAPERIIEFYSPTSGMPGKELPQLMSGIEYPGISVQGLSFDYTTDWDISYSPFGKSSYADNVNYYLQAEITSPAIAGTDTLVVSTTTGVTVGQIVNIISAVKSQSTETVFSSQISNPNFDVRVIEVHTATSSIKVNSILSQSLLGTNTNTIIDGAVTTVTNTATIEFWSYDANSTILDSAIDGGTWNTLTNALSGALGINPDDIIISGDGFITPNTSYAPEEYVPGETHDTLGINVYTRLNEGAPTVYNGTVDIYKDTITTATLSFAPPNIASLFVTFANKNFSYTTGTYHLTNYDVPQFSFNWETNQLTVGPQNYTGKLGYTIVSIGGGRPNAQAGVIDRGFAVVNDGGSEAEVVSMSSTATVKTAYVTVNGQSIPKLTTINTTTLGYQLITSSFVPNRAAAHVYNIPAGTTATVQAWFFGTTNKYFNEFKEQIFEIGLDFEDEFVLDQPPGNIEPAAGNIIVEIDTGDGTGFRRMQPPFISYYKVNPAVKVYKVDNNIERVFGSFINPNVRVYLNGTQLLASADYSFNFTTQEIEIRDGILKEGDVLAILGIPTAGAPLAEYDIQGATLRLATPIVNSKLRVVTFANHDDMLVRTETFLGNLNRRFTVSRNIVNNNFVWVTIDGRLLVNKYDYTVLEDSRTIELSDRWHPTANNLVVITSISSDALTDTVLGYRIFNDIFNRTHYKRLSKKHSTVLTKALYFNDTEIHVADTSVLMPPLTSKKIPGVVIINGERIEYLKIEGNVLKQLRRSTLGTSPKLYLPEGTKVIDQSPEQNIPFVDKTYKQIIYTTASVNTYVISTTSFAVNNTGTNISGETLYFNTQTSDGIVFSSVAPAEDQVNVYYGGRPLRKSGIFKQDTSISYDNPDINFANIGTTSTVLDLPVTDIVGTAVLVTSTNQVWVYTNSIEESAVNGYVYKGLNFVEPEFTINTSSNQITLNIENEVQNNVRLVITKKEFNRADIWNDQITTSTTKSLLDSTTAPARFLQSKLAELPNEYYYGEGPLLNFSSGLGLTDENNEPLEGL